MTRKKTTVEDFWRGYEEKTGEKVLAFSLGQYLSGWAGENGPLWGLLIATDRGFRFHHFPQENWFQAITRTSAGAEAPREKAFFIPRERILALEFRREKSFFKRIFLPRFPLLHIRYLDQADREALFTAAGDDKAGAVAVSIRGLLQSRQDAGTLPPVLSSVN
jgi:hypothetical protein